jgi:type II secretory pathway pseudopilin PulG
MTIPFTCPHCGTQTDVFDDYAGQSGPCAICGKPITVPVPSDATKLGSTWRPPVPAQNALSRPRSKALTIVLVTLAGIAAAAILGAVLFALVFPALSSARQASRRSQSATNLKAIAAALLAYESAQGCFPPAYIADSKGKPMHSWRVLVLPYLGYSHIHAQYDFNQPWNSPHNMNLLGSMPAEYACPADPDARANHEANYVVVVGAETLFPGSKSVRREQMSDGAHCTILVAQTRSSGVTWLEPRDLEADQMCFEINGRAGVEIGGSLPGGAHVATADGVVHFLPEDLPPPTVRAMATISGNEPFPAGSSELR